MTLLCAIDETSEPAVKLATKMALCMDQELLILAVEFITYSDNEEKLEEMVKQASVLALSLGAKEPKTSIVRSRDVVRAICRFAKLHDVSHIVVGSRRKGPASRYILGSVSRDVVLQAHCSVTVAK
jgi:nucleotide-binding universal stress UspA family protein